MINTFWIAELPLMTVLAVSRILVFSDVIQTVKMHTGVKVVRYHCVISH